MPNERNVRALADLLGSDEARRMLEDRIRRYDFNDVGLGAGWEDELAGWLAARGILAPDTLTDDEVYAVTHAGHWVESRPEDVRAELVRLAKGERDPKNLVGPDGVWHGGRP